MDPRRSHVPSSDTRPPALPSDVAARIQGLTKTFGSTVALDDVTIEVQWGEVVGLVGHNGSGKSTLARILTGYHVPDRGRIWLNGIEQRFPVDSAKNALAAIHQDLCLQGDMSVAENFAISLTSSRGPFRRINWRRQNEKTRQVVRELGIECSPITKVAELAPADRAAVAIARALISLQESSDRGILLVDEATAYLSTREATTVARLLRRLAASGHAVLFIGHKLKEVLEISDRVIVLRSGRIVGDLKPSGTTPDRLVAVMLGRPLRSFYPDPPLTGTVSTSTDPVLRVRHLHSSNLKDVTFDLYPGEILGVTGLAGSPFDRLPYALMGDAPVFGGSVALDGKALRSTATIQSAMSIVPADRAKRGMWLEATAEENYALPRLASFMSGARLQRRRMTSETRNAMDQFRVHPLLPKLKAAAFSGGNQQKILLASRLRETTMVILLHEPTQGVDAMAKREILEKIQAAAVRGLGVMMFSSDYEELINTCSRVLVMNSRGSIGTIMSTTGKTEHDVLAACIAVQ
jgi:ribose transport system ATP-binding protein